MAGLSLYRRLLKRIHWEGVPWPETILYDYVSRKEIFQSYYRLVADDVLGRRDSGSLLDVGTGPARLLQRIHELAPGMELAGIDLSPSMLAAARRNLAEAGLAEKVRIEHGSAEKIPFPSCAFDIVVSTASIHHWKNPTACLNEVYRILKPGGDALVYDLVSDTPADKVADMHRRFGKLMTLMFFIHSFEEPFYTYEAFASLAGRTLFRRGEMRWVGILCCLALKK